MDAIKDVKPFTICFDESLNNISNRKKMDVHILYFDDNTNRVQRSYIGSSFMGHADAVSCLEHLKERMKDIDYTNNLLQLSMDGPNVNWKVLGLLKEDRQENNSQAPDLLSLGSCGIHVLHGAYTRWQQVTDWELDKLLKDCFGIFKKSPARRLDYLEANGLHESHDGQDTAYLFPLKLCGHRWLENSKAIIRMLEIWEYIRKYFSFLETEKQFPKKDERFIRIRILFGLHTTEAMLQFSLCILKDIEPSLVIPSRCHYLYFFMRSSREL